MIAYFKDLLASIREDSKKLHKSATIWFNSVMGTLAVVLPFAQDQLPAMQAYLPAHIYNYMMGAVVLGNIVLRYKTTKRLADK